VVTKLREIKKPPENQRAILLYIYSAPTYNLSMEKYSIII